MGRRGTARRELRNGQEGREVKGHPPISCYEKKSSNRRRNLLSVYTCLVYQIVIV